MALVSLSVVEQRYRAVIAVLDQGASVSEVAAEFGVSLVPASVCQIRVEGVAYTDVLGNAISIRLSLASRMEAAPATG